MSKRQSSSKSKSQATKEKETIGTLKKRKHIKVEYEENNGENNITAWQPQHFEEQWSNIISMRSRRDAPVDVIGCDKLGDRREQPKVLRYQHLLALMLSSQTKDEVTSAAMTRLKEHGCNIDNLLATSTEELQKLLYPVGFYKRKAEYIKKTSQILRDDYNYDIPDTAENMCKLPGVGPKMAHILMRVAWDVVSGIGVDVHVHRIVNRLEWVKSPTKQPEQTRIALEEWLPRVYWSEINALLVGFGQQICQPQRPMCTVCLNSDICPTGRKEKKQVKKVKK